MDIPTDRTYRFAASPAELWATLGRIDDYRTWWPWLSSFDASGLHAGATWECIVQPPLPYSVSFILTVEEVVAERLVRARVSGDIVGSAELFIVGTDPGCQVRLTANLAPGSLPLRAIATIARPLVRLGHDWVLDTGARQFSARALA